MSKAMFLSAETTQLPSEIYKYPPNSSIKTNANPDETSRTSDYFRQSYTPVVGRRFISDFNTLHTASETPPKFPIPIPFEKSSRTLKSPTSPSLKSTKKILRPQSNPKPPIHTPELHLVQSPMLRKSPISKKRPKKILSPRQKRKKLPVCKSVEPQQMHEQLRWMASTPALPQATSPPPSHSPKPPTSPKVQSLMIQSIRNQKQQQMQASLNRIEMLENKQKRKKLLEQYNAKTRTENNKKFKKKQFNPKIAWGIDSRKIDGTYDHQVRKQREEIRMTKATLKEQTSPKLDVGFKLTIKKKKPRQLRNQAINQMKEKKSSDPKVIDFIKLQKRKRREQTETHELNKQAEETRRLSQLKYLELFNKRSSPKRKKKPKPQKSPSPAQIWVQSSNLSDTGDQEVRNIMKKYHNISQGTESDREGRECKVFGYFDNHIIDIRNGNATQVYNDYIARKIRITEPNAPVSMTLPLVQEVPTEGQSLRTFEMSKESSREIAAIDASRKKEEIKKKLHELRTRIDKAKVPVSDYVDQRDRKQYVFQIRRAFRRWVRYRPIQMEYESEDFAVQQIMGTANDHRQAQKRIIQEVEELQARERKVEKILEIQNTYHQQQQEILQKFRNKDIQEIQTVMAQFEEGEDLAEFFMGIIDRRYLALSHLFQEKIHQMQNVIESLENVSQEQKSELIQRFQDNSKMLMEGYSEFLLREQAAELDRHFSSKQQKDHSSEYSANFVQTTEKDESLSRKLRSISPLPSDYSSSDGELFGDSRGILSFHSLRNNRLSSSEDLQHDPHPMILPPRTGQIVNAQELKFDIGSRSEMETPQDTTPQISILSGMNIESDSQDSNYIPSPHFNDSYRISFGEQSEKSINFSQDGSSLLQVSVYASEWILLNKPICGLYILEQEISIIMPQPNNSYQLIDSDLEAELSENPITSESFDMNIPDVQLNPDLPDFLEDDDKDLRVITISASDFNQNPITLETQSPIFVETGNSANSSLSQPKEDNSSLLDSLHAESDEIPLPNLRIPSYEPPNTSLLTPQIIQQISEIILNKLLSENVMPNIPQLPSPALSSDVEESHYYSIKQYTDTVFDALLDRQDEVIDSLCRPLLQSPNEQIAKIQESGIHLHEEPFMIHPILPIQLYLELEHQMQLPSNDNYTEESYLILTEAFHIHNKLIFDAINQVLQQYRPYGTKGIPMPWSSETRSLRAHIDLETISDEISEVIENWSSFQAGKVPTQDMLLENGQIDEQQLQQIREERLANMLATDVIEQDNLWIDYEWEETQTTLDLADIIIESLLVESIELLSTFN